MDTILDAAKYLSDAITILPKSSEIPDLYDNAPNTKFSDVVDLWNRFNSFMSPIAEQHAKLGDRMQYTVLHNFYVFFQMYGNRFQTALVAVNRELALSGNAIEYQEFSDEALKILRLVAETNKTYVLGGIALRNVANAYHNGGGDVMAFLTRPIDTKIFVSSQADLQAAVKFRQERRADAAPTYRVLGAETTMAKFQERSLIRAPFLSHLFDAKPLMDLPGFLDGAELSSERGGIDIPIGEDWGVNIDGGLADPHIEISIYGDFDWDAGLEGVVEAIGGAISDAFDCGY